MQISPGLAHAIYDFLTGRKFFVEIDGIRSASKNMDVGCVQGSILGPRLFTLYMGRLMETIKEDIISYADDSYVVVTGSSMSEIKSKIESTSKEHVAFLKRLGMVVNRSKTEIIVFDKKFEETGFVIDGEIVNSKSSIKALGITFQHNLKWDKHVSIITARVAPKLSMLKKIRKNLNKDQFLKLVQPKSSAFCTMQRLFG